MDNCISVTNELQDVLDTVELSSEIIKLPQIVVVGSQSAGKSSVLESIVGHDFLPRGSDIVTRCPLILRMTKINKGEDPRRRAHDGTAEAEVWAEFGHAKGRPYFDFDEVKKEIERQTEILAPGKDVSRTSISLQIYSETTLDLTLVDLPGMTQNAREGQSEEIVTIIEEMVKAFVDNPESLILTISPGTEDVVNSVGLKVAKKADPKGERTLAVITKLDRIESATKNITQKVLLGQTIQVELGIIGVINRSPADIEANKSMAQCIKDEKAFLEKNYPSIAARNGIQYLRKRLSNLLMGHIQKCLPGVRLRINEKLAENEGIVDDLGEQVTEPKKHVRQIIRKYAEAYKNTLDGNAADLDEDLVTSSGALISLDNFFGKFREELEDVIALDGVSDEDIYRTIRSSTGTSPALMTPSNAFINLTRKQLRRLEQPAVHCVELVASDLRALLQNCGTEIKRELDRFPRLANEVDALMTETINGYERETKAYIKREIKHLSKYINTHHDDFWERLGDLMKRWADLKEDEKSGDGSEDEESVGHRHSLGAGDASEEDDQELTPKQKKECALMRDLVDLYFYIVVKHIRHSVPVLIHAELVDQVKENMYESLDELGDKASQLVVESPDNAQKRVFAEEMIRKLKKAQTIISRIGVSTK